jgi:two-component system sensor kinase FixL
VESTGVSGATGVRPKHRARAVAEANARAAEMLVRLEEVNAQLERAQEASKGANRELERRVEQRTAALRANEDKYRSVIENASEAIIVLQDGRVKFANPRASELTGFAFDEFKDHSFVELIHPDDRQTGIDHYQRRLKGEQFESVYPLRLTVRDGRTLWVEARAALINWDGRPAVLDFLTDITRRKQAEAALHESEEKYRTLVERANDGIIIIQDGIVKFANPRMAELNGSHVEQIVGTPYADHIHPDELPRMTEFYRRRLAGEDVPQAYETVLRRMDGGPVPVEMNAGLVSFEGRSADMVIVRDITERKQTEQELEAHRHHLEDLVAERTRELTQAQNELVKRERQATIGQIAASMAHELRNPLGSMHNAVIYLNMAERQSLSEKGLRHLAVIDSQIERSNRIITALLDFAESQPAVPRVLPVSAVLDEVLRLVPAPGNVRVKMEVAADVPPVFADPEQVKTALRNLIENAFLAMPDGGQLTLRAGSTSGRNGSAPQVQVQVEDTGCGIETEHLLRLFEPLFSTRTVGVGLGLPIARKLVEANHGSIAVRSEPGKGATFTVTLPRSSE